MSRREKLISRFRELPSDFSWDELETLLKNFGYVVAQGAGSRVRFIDDSGQKIVLHRPHPGNIMKKYVMKEIDGLLMEHGKYGK